MAIRYTAKHRDEHGTELVKTRTSRGHRQPEYTHAYWLKGKDGAWKIGGFSRREDIASREAARFVRGGYYAASAVVPVTAEQVNR